MAILDRPAELRIGKSTSFTKCDSRVKHAEAATADKVNLLNEQKLITAGGRKRLHERK